MIDEKIKIVKNDTIDIIALFQILWTDRKFIFKFTGFITLIGVLYTLLVTPLYKSNITIYPRGEVTTTGLSQLKGMASIMGVNMGASDHAFNIPDIIHSRRLQTKIIYRKWGANIFNSPVDLISYWGINVESKYSFNPLNWFADSKHNMRLKWESSALKELSKRISVIENKSGLINISVLMENPELSAEISNYIFDAVIEFFNKNHFESAKLNREFIEKRQKEVESILINAENKLKEFRSKNRKVIDSPQLQLELERLMRDVEIQTQIFITLQQEYEIARIEEVKETPSVLVLDKGMPAVEKHSPKRKLIVIMYMFSGLIFGNIFILIKRLF